MWTIEDHEQQALAQVQAKNFRKDVINHVIAKLQMRGPVDEAELRTNVARQYDNADSFLRHYPEATYRSYVFMTLIYCALPPEVMDSPEPWRWLKNDRIGINTRVDLAYQITRAAIDRAS